MDHIDFNVEKGEIFGFLGPNSAGKTTTQRMLTTLLTLTEGRILINGHDLAHDAYAAKAQIGLVPEESNVYTELTAWDNLMFTGRLYRMSKNDRGARRRVAQALRAVGEKGCQGREFLQGNETQAQHRYGDHRHVSIPIALYHHMAAQTAQAL